MTALAIRWGPWVVAEPTPDDLALTSAVAKGDAVAAERYARRVLPTVRRIARAMIADPVEADDAIQHALLELLRAAKTYRGAGSLDGWARRVASRAMLRHAARARSSRLHAPPSGDAPAAMNTTVLETLPRSLEHYLAELPEVQRTALLLRHALGHTIVEIAEITGAPVPTVRSRIKKGQLELRRLVQRDVNLGRPDKARSS